MIIFVLKIVEVFDSSRIVLYPVALSLMYLCFLKKVLRASYILRFLVVAITSSAIVLL
jgi:hypothetical protein